MSEITLWKPEPDLAIHQALGKLGEEANELATIVARCLIQGIEASDPKTGKPNRQALVEEISDVTAAILWLRDTASLTPDQQRTQRKFEGFLEWRAMLDEHRTEQIEEIAAEIVREICDLAPADPGHPDTIAVSSHDLHAIAADKIGTSHADM